jgi:hypothetical protein
MGRDDALKVHFKATGHTYRVHAGTRRQALADALAELGFATGPSHIKNLMTVLAIIKFLGPDIPPAALAPLFALLPRAAVKQNRDLMRGSIAVGVAMLRSANMGNPQIMRWLDSEIKRRALDFTAREAMRLFYDCSAEEASVSRDALAMFRALRPEPSTSLTEAVAKERVAQILDRAVVMKAGPLTRPRRPG